MTFLTLIFNERKKNGYIKKIGSCRFFNGNTETKRVLYKDIETGEEYVVLNGNVWTFKRYRNQLNGTDYIIGRV